MKVDIYFNLHKMLWSVRDMATRKVINHSYNITMKDVKFIVSQKGRLKVNKEKCKNVHAYARGVIINSSYFRSDKYLKQNGYREAYYNPYKTICFIDKITGNHLTKTYLVYMRAKDKSVWYK